MKVFFVHASFLYLFEGKALLVYTMNDFQIHQIAEDQNDNLEIQLNKMSANISDFHEENKLWSLIVPESVDDDCPLFRGK